MACSKIFLGDLPELWCRVTIPLLWEDPFSIESPKNYRFIEIYLCFLNEDSKAKFDEYGINDNLLVPSNNTLFNYPSFIKYLDTDKIFYSIKYWKFGNYLENFGLEFVDIIDDYYEPRSKRQLFEIIMKNCKNIRYFDSNVFDDNNIYLIIKNNQHNINYLTIEVNFYDYDTVYNEFSSTVLKNLGQILPSKLEYLCLTLSFNNSDLEIFLKNSQNTFIKKLLIRNIVVNEDENINNINILFYIKKYILKKERVKYLAILESDNDEDELFFFKEELYN
uniref:Uncharacterized protein n=1 Tax=Rhizophagus irregularis (strain DAOM 181602 / DAOM 197198 / MUCL 43194) TaxID=747089 RepID=U9UCR6_RHIID